MTYQRTFLPVGSDSDFISKRVPGIRSCTKLHQTSYRRAQLAGEFSVRGTPSARRERGELSFAPAPVLQAAGGGLSNNRWSLAGLTPSSTVRRLSALDPLGSARPVRLQMR